MVDRLFQIIYLLMERPKLTAEELSDLFEVSKRTIYRDIDKLSLAGVPIYTIQGKNGGISLLPEYVLNKAILTEEEKIRLSASLSAINELGYQDEKNDISKLHDFFGDKFQDWLEVDFSSWGTQDAESNLFDILRKSILERHYVKITYSGNRDPLTKRMIKPLKLCFKNQAWYLYAYCCLKEEYRFFKLRRISEILVLDHCYEFEKVGKVLRDHSEAYLKEQKSIRVTMEVGAAMSFRVFDEMPEIIQKDHDRFICSVEVKDMDWFIGYVLSYGPYMKVLEPQFIKEKVMQAINAMKDLY